MQIALINKLNNKFVITEISEFGGLDLEIFSLWASIDNNTKFHYKALLNLYNHVYINESSVLNQKITTGSFIFDPNDLRNIKAPETEVHEPSDLELKKIEFLNKLDKDFSMNINKTNFLKYIHYINLFNYFASIGIFITKENKEDRYIEILELDDETAIEKLELYLNLQDEIDEFLNLNTNLINLKEEIEYADEEEFDKILEENQTTSL
jgi:hypothetical protein